MLNDDFTNIDSSKHLFLIRGVRMSNLILAMPFYIFFISLFSIFLFGTFPRSANFTDIFLYGLVLIFWLLLLFSLIQNILAYLSKIEAFENGLAVTNLFLQKRIIPFSMLDFVTYHTIERKKYFVLTVAIINHLCFHLKDGEEIKFKSVGKTKQAEEIIHFLQKTEELAPLAKVKYL